MHDPMKELGHHTTPPSAETAGYGFGRKEQETSRECDFREEQQGFRKGEEQQTGCSS